MIVYEQFSGVYENIYDFEIVFINKALCEINKELKNRKDKIGPDRYVTVNEVNEKFGLRQIDPRIGDHLGWVFEKGSPLSVELGFSINEKCENPVMYFSYTRYPSYIVW